MKYFNDFMKKFEKNTNFEYRFKLVTSLKDKMKKDEKFLEDISKIILNKKKNKKFIRKMYNFLFCKKYIKREKIRKMEMLSSLYIKQEVFKNG